MITLQDSRRAVLRVNWSDIFEVFPNSNDDQDETQHKKNEAKCLTEHSQQLPLSPVIQQIIVGAVEVDWSLFEVLWIWKLEMIFLC